MGKLTPEKIQWIIKQKKRGEQSTRMIAAIQGM